MTIPIQIPETLSGNPAWSDWVAQLPDILSTRAEQWHLDIQAPMTGEHAEMSLSYIAPARQPDGSEVILKVPSPTQRSSIGDRERESLSLCGGSGVVELLGHDEDSGTLLLERVRPGTPLSVGTDDDENTRIAARMMRAFWRLVPKKHGFRSTDHEMDGFARLREQAGGTTGKLPEHWVTRAEGFYDELMATCEEMVVLHADLHHYNILSAEREPWLVIDPKGYFGDPGYDVGAYLANYPDESCEGLDLDEVDRLRAEILSEELGMPGDRVAKWGIVLAVIWARWSIDTPEEFWRESIRRAGALDAML